MKMKRLGLAVGMTLGMAAIFVTGCATNRIDLVEQGIVSVETVPSKRVRILWTDIYQDGDDTVVYGVVQRRSHTSYPIRTHVDITMLSSDGKVLQEARTGDIYVARRIPDKGINWTRFRLRLPGIPVEGSKVKMVVHGRPHNDRT
jgi:hypothetical protein